MNVCIDIHILYCIFNIYSIYIYLACCETLQYLFQTFFSGCFHKEQDWVPSGPSLDSKGKKHPDPHMFVSSSRVVLF